MIKDLESGCRGLKLALALFGGVGAAILCYAGYKYYVKRRDALEARANTSLLDEIITSRSREESNDHDAAPTGGGSSSGACVVCLGRQREVILLNCSHVCMCADCAREIVLRDRKCPVCRADIDRVAPAFIS